MDTQVPVHTKTVNSTKIQTSKFVFSVSVHRFTSLIYYVPQKTLWVRCIKLGDSLASCFKRFKSRQSFWTWWSTEYEHPSFKKFLSKKWGSEEFSIWRLISVFDHPSILFNDTYTLQFFLTLTQKSLTIDNVLQLRPILLNFHFLPFIVSIRMQIDMGASCSVLPQKYVPPRTLTTETERTPVN